VVLWGGWPFSCALAIGGQLESQHVYPHRSGVGVAWSYSLVAVLVPGIFPQSVYNAMGVVPVYFEAALSSPPWCYWGKCWNCARAAD